jgi:hypothetical protein
VDYKDDWEQAQARLLAWWQCEVIDRACIQVYAPRAGVQPSPPPVPTSEEARWTDIDYVVAAQGERMRCTYFGGEAFPLFNPDLGPDIFAAFLGAPLHFAPDTSWADPILTDWETRPPLRLDPANHWWQLQTGLVAAGKAAGQGKWLAGIPDTHSGGDALAALRGRQALCFDLIDRPEQVEAAMAELTEMVVDVYARFYALLDWQQQGSSSGWLPTWSTGRCNVIQCDFLALISPAMAERFIMQELATQARWLDQVIYHLDGPQCICHLDWLLTIPKIHAIQWVPGAGNLPMTRWIPLLQRIQAAGRAIHISVEPREVEVCLRELKPEGLLMQTTVASEAEARDLVRRVEHWYVQRVHSR